MKKQYFVFAAILFVALQATTSCSKKSVAPENAANISATAAKDDNKIVFSYQDQDGNTITFDEMNAAQTEESILFASDDANGDIIIRHFQNESQFGAFAATDIKYDIITEQIQAANALRAYVDEHGEKDYEAQTGDISQEFKDFMSQYSFGNKTTGAGIMYDNLNGTGSTCGLSGNPQFSLFSFRNKAESARGAGLANWLWDKRWWGGRSIYLLLGTGGLIPFNNLNFQNMAESSL